MSKYRITYLDSDNSLVTIDPEHTAGSGESQALIDIADFADGAYPGNAYYDSANTAVVIGTSTISDAERTNWYGRGTAAYQAGLQQFAEITQWQIETEQQGHAADVHTHAVEATRRWYLHQKGIYDLAAAGDLWASETRAELTTRLDHYVTVIAPMLRTWYQAMIASETARNLWRAVSVAAAAPLYSDGYEAAGTTRTPDGTFTVITGATMPATTWRPHTEGGGTL